MCKKDPEASVSLSELDSLPSSLICEETLMTNFETLQNVDNYFGEKITGYFKAPVSGTYTFFVSGDDGFIFSISDGLDPANKE